MIDYTLIRSKRKTAALYVREGAVEVRAPLKMPKSEIDKFVASKEKWINKQLAQSDERQAKRDSFSLDYGNTVTYRGIEYPIIAVEGNRVGFDGERFYMPPGLPPERVKGACIQIYQMLAKNDLTDRVADLAKIMGVLPIAVKINNAATRWGSCSAKKSLNFSWLLIMANENVIDYVIVHELAHITEMNHSKRFWSIVENMLPDYRERQAQLKKLQQQLRTEDWG